MEKVTQMKDNDFNTLLGLAVFEKQLKLSATASIPEIFGIQFVKILKDVSQDPLQTDPLEFVAYFNALRQMELNQKVQHMILYKPCPHCIVRIFFYFWYQSIEDW